MSATVDAVKRRKPVTALPDSFAVVLRHMHWTKDQHLNAVLRAAAAAGWQQQALAFTLGCTPQNISWRVRQASATTDLCLPEIPVPPARPKSRPPVPGPRKVVKVSPAVAARLRDLQTLATTVRGGTPSSSPARRAGEELAALLADLHFRRSVSISELARVLDVTRSAIQSRLGRHGYRPAAPSAASGRYQGGRFDGRAAA